MKLIEWTPFPILQPVRSTGVEPPFMICTDPSVTKRPAIYSESVGVGTVGTDGSGVVGTGVGVGVGGIIGARSFLHTGGVNVIFGIVGTTCMPWEGTGIEIDAHDEGIAVSLLANEGIVGWVQLEGTADELGGYNNELNFVKESGLYNAEGFGIAGYCHESADTDETRRNTQKIMARALNTYNRLTDMRIR
jgi:hypothetical protein